MSVDAIRQLREETGCGIMECKRALAESSGDTKKAKEILRQKGLEMALKKSDRAAKEGRVEAYIHNGNKIGVIVE
ncbi:MAG: elongation factor Ts, partial [Elusimicrobia bacterium]|nr:elongation factor Ts [Elusimicrobiota bacterium]